MHHLSLEPHQLLGQLLAEQRHRARQAFRRMVDTGLLSIEQEVAGLRHHHRRQNPAQLLSIPQPVATKRGARLAGEITGLASLAQPPGPNHTLAHTGAPCSSAWSRRRTCPAPIAVRQCCSGLA